MNKVILLGIDGLKPSQITELRMPNLFRMVRQGTLFTNHHSVFPTVTRVNTVSMLTGCYPGRHGLVGNTMVLKDYDESLVVPALKPQIESVNKKIKSILLVPNIVDIVSNYGLEFAAVNIGSNGNAYLHNQTLCDSGIVIHPEFTIPNMLYPDIISRFGEWPEKSQYDEVRLKYAMEIFTSHVLDELNPDIAMFWCNNPDSVQHYSPLGGESSNKALAIVDSQIGELQKYIERSGRNDLNILIVSDHGYSTIKGVVDIEDFVKSKIVEPIKCDEEILVAPNGGSVLFYVNPFNRNTLEILIDHLIVQPWCGNIFASHKDGIIEGTIDVSKVGLNGIREPDLAMSFKWSDGFNENNVQGLVYSSSGKSGDGQHGSIGLTEQRSVFIGYGPDFKENNFVANPTGNIDITPTIVQLLGIEPNDDFDGRIVKEGLIGNSQINTGLKTQRYHAKRTIGVTSYEQELEVLVLDGSVYINNAKVF